ncbi:hypothetical protein J6590_031017 [Homalodisca vitripennis]|nr:hypothetical protein J6590_031017 [Homalodisca vitripennis]
MAATLCRGGRSGLDTGGGGGEAKVRGRSHDPYRSDCVLSDWRKSFDIIVHMITPCRRSSVKLATLPTRRIQITEGIIQYENIKGVRHLKHSHVIGIGVIFGRNTPGRVRVASPSRAITSTLLSCSRCLIDRSQGHGYEGDEY